MPRESCTRDGVRSYANSQAEVTLHVTTSNCSTQRTVYKMWRSRLSRTPEQKLRHMPKQVEEEVMAHAQAKFMLHTRKGDGGAQMGGRSQIMRTRKSYTNCTRGRGGAIWRKENQQVAASVQDLEARIYHTRQAKPKQVEEGIQADRAKRTRCGGKSYTTRPRRCHAACTSRWRKAYKQANTSAQELEAEVIAQLEVTLHAQTGKMWRGTLATK